MNGKNNRWVRPTILFLSIIVVYVLFWIVIDLSIHSVEERGVFGDKFGAINALFSGLAFAGLVLTLFLQKEELSLQRDELEQTRKELSRQSNEFEIQNFNLNLQRFESSFFSLLSHYLELVNRLEYSSEDGADPYEGKGYRVFEWLFASQHNFRNESYGFYGLIRNETSLNSIKNAYVRYRGLQNIQPCMVFLCKILSFVDQANLLHNKELYLDILFSHLTSFEVAFLFYHALANNVNLHRIEQPYRFFAKNEFIPETHYRLLFPSIGMNIESPAH